MSLVDFNSYKVKNGIEDNEPFFHIKNDWQRGNFGYCQSFYWPILCSKKGRSCESTQLNFRSFNMVNNDQNEQFAGSEGHKGEGDEKFIVI